MVVLHARPGDCQALKAVIAAEVAHGAPLDVNTGNIPQNVFGSNRIALSLPGGDLLTESNAIAAFLGGKDVKPLQLLHQVNQWLEWEANTLRPATYSGQADGALADLAAAVQGKRHLVGECFTLADIAVFCTLLPLRQSSSLPAAVVSYLDGLSNQPAVAVAKRQLLGDDGVNTLQAAFAADAAAWHASQPKLPQKGQRNILITSALPYVNNVPHLGNIIGCVLSADVYARYCRSRGHNAIFICGTDEYGTATETKALEEGLTCAQICDKYHAVHKSVYEWFGISFDKFGRTPTRQQTAICQSLFQDLWQRGACVEQTMEQLYSEALGKFLADRFVVGTCPKCGYEDARGDQCDSCGNLMNPVELINPRCKVSGTTPVVKTTRHIFLDLPQLTEKLQEYITNTSKLGGWSANCVQLTNAWMRDGLKQRCITRDLQWGIPVPLEGFGDKVFYVWFDAPIGYISITANYTPEWRKWWQSPEEVELVQFMGKDNVPFHTVIFPATLLGSGGKWTMMRSISVTEYLNYEGGKFSKSRGVGVFGSDAKDTGIPPEVWRYYLLASRPESSDCDFRWADLQARNNNELLKNLGNLVNRMLMFVAKNFEGKVPTPTAKGAEQVAELGQLIHAKVLEYCDALERQKLREGLRLAMAVSGDANKFITDTEPFRLLKTDREHASTLVAAALGCIRLVAALIEPYMPTLTEGILKQMQLPADAARLSDKLIAGALHPATLVQAGHSIGVPSPLISEIRDEVVEQLRERYSGSQSERAASAAAASTSNAAGQAAKGGKPKVAAAAAGAAEVGGKAEKAGKAAAAGKSAADKAAAKGSSDGKKPAAAPAAERPADVSRLDIRVGKILKAWRHPDAESLYIEEIDVGEAAPRQVVSGLVKYIPEEQMQGRCVALLCNLKPANMRGVQSQAMVLCASSADGRQVELVEPPKGAEPGDRIWAAGFDSQPDEQLNPRKKVFEAVQPDLATNDQRVACYKGVPLACSKGPCTVESITNGSIR